MAKMSAALAECWKDPAWRERQRAKASEFAGRPAGLPIGVNRETHKRFVKQARLEATLTMKKLEAAGVIDEADGQAKEALHCALTIMRTGDLTVKDRLAAARTVLEWTKAKPAQKTELTVTKAEEWLEAVTQDNGNTETDEGTDRSA